MKLTETTPLFLDLPSAQTVVMLGQPGIGKTTCARMLADQMTVLRRAEDPDAPEAICEVIDSTSRLPEDIQGLPFRDGEATSYCPPEWLLPLCQPAVYGVLCLDDLPASMPAVQVAMRMLVLERRVGRHRLSDGIKILVTGNRRQDKSSAKTLPAHFRNACLFVQIEPDLDEWAAWAAQNDVPGVISAFLRYRPQFHSRLPADADDHGVFATPRTWFMVGRCFEAARKHAMVRDVAAGLVGEGVAAEFAAFVEIAAALPNPRAVLENPKAAMPNPPKKADQLIAISTALGEITAKLVKESEGDDAAITKLAGQFLTAVAHVTDGNREYCGSAVSTFLSNGGDINDLVKGARTARKNKGVADMLRFLKSVLIPGAK